MHAYVQSQENGPSGPPAPVAPTGTWWKALELHLGWNQWTDLQGLNMLSEREGQA